MNSNQKRGFVKRACEHGLSTKQANDLINELAMGGLGGSAVGGLLGYGFAPRGKEIKHTLAGTGIGAGIGAMGAGILHTPFPSLLESNDRIQEGLQEQVNNYRRTLGLDTDIDYNQKSVVPLDKIQSYMRRLNDLKDMPEYQDLQDTKQIGKVLRQYKDLSSIFNKSFKPL